MLIGEAIYPCSHLASGKACPERRDILVRYPPSSMPTLAGTTSQRHPSAPALELQIGKRAHADARHQDLILGVGDVVADVLVQQVVADEADRHLARAEPGWIELRPVADLRLQQIIARGRRLTDRGDIVLREGVQQVDPREPVGIAPEQAATDTHRRNARNVGTVAEGCAHHVELVLDAPDAAVERTDIQLALEFTAAEGGVALRIDRL